MVTKTLSGNYNEARLNVAFRAQIKIYENLAGIDSVHCLVCKLPDHTKDAPAKVCLAVRQHLNLFQLPLSSTLQPFIC